MAEAEAEIQGDNEGKQQQKEQSRLKFWKRGRSGEAKNKAKKDKPKDSARIGCGGLFRRKRRDSGDEPTEKPAVKKNVSGNVKIEEGPSTAMWNSIVRNSLVGTGVFTRAAACSLESGGVLARRPDDFTPTVEQVRALNENFTNRSVFNAAGFGVADLLFDIQEETGTKTVLSGASDERQEGVLVTKSKTALLIGVYVEKQKVAMEMMDDMREQIASQGL